MNSLWYWLFFLWFVVAMVVNWKAIKRALDEIVEFFKAALQDGCVRDLFSWLGWSIVVALVIKVAETSTSVEVKIFHYFLLFVWLGTGLAVVDNIVDFILGYMEKKRLSKELLRERHLLLAMLLISTISVFLLLTTLETAKEIVTFLLRKD